MGNVTRNNVIRFIILFLLQVFVFKRVSTGWQWYGYIHIIIYPLYLILLPLNMPRSMELISAFALGLLVDVFYGSLGVHASASVFTAFMRPGVLALLRPREGYKINLSPTFKHFGAVWFFQYASMVLLIHLLFYFSAEAFTLVYWKDILLKTFSSYILSIGFIMIPVLIFNPDN